MILKKSRKDINTKEIALTSGRCYADVTTEKQAKANSKRPFLVFLFFQFFNPFRRIPVVPDRAVFRKSPGLSNFKPWVLQNLGIVEKHGQADA